MTSNPPVSHETDGGRLPLPVGKEPVGYLVIRRERTKRAERGSHKDNCYQLFVFDVRAHHATAILAEASPVKTGTTPIKNQA